MEKVVRISAPWGALMLALFIGCSDDSEGGGSGDGDGDVRGSGGFVTTTGGRAGGDGDGPSDPCFGELVTCRNSCVDLSSDEDNCGACGESCDDSQVCEEGVCVDDPGGNAGGEGGVGGESAGGAGGAD